jgi:hypothetical protein
MSARTHLSDRYQQILKGDNSTLYRHGRTGWLENSAGGVQIYG